MIDEWDCIFREQGCGEDGWRKYLNFLRNWMKDKPYISLAYMTGILPIKKYGSHSALNMFTEYSMTNPKRMGQYMGFAGEEVEGLCRQYQISFEEVKAWYDGYSFEGVSSIYSPKSVVECLTSGIFDNYWNQTETFEALKVYIQMNYDGLKDSVIEMIAGNRVRVNTGSFTNDMKTFHTVDDVLTLLVHLGYLAYDFERKEVYIPRAKYPDKPAMVIELKWDKSVEGAIGQIKEKDYPAALKGYEGSIFLAGISYSRRMKRHTCVIDELK